MENNDLIILRRILEEQKQEDYSGLPADKHFEIFVADQVTKDFDLSNDEVYAGVLGGSRDGGVDSIYCFVNKDLVRDDTDSAVVKRSALVELYLVQSKLHNGFGEYAIEKFRSMAADLLDLSHKPGDFKDSYDNDLLAAIARFRDLFQTLAAKFPKLKIVFTYACMGDASKLNPEVVRKVGLLEEQINRLFSGCEFSFVFLGARELLESVRRQPLTSFQMQFLDNPLSSGKGVGYVFLVPLPEFYRFIADENGNLRKGIFESNVRDYQGSTEVNQGISQTLSSNRTDDFWWLNNGVTVVATQGSINGKVLSVENPQIVNGLQTSEEVFRCFKEAPDVVDDRSLLVRVLVTGDAATRDKVIKATNSQTSIPPASLRATDSIQRDIEDFFATRGLYYDRRKNKYRNEGKPNDKIVSIPYLAQSVVAVLLGQPDYSRARPSTLIKNDGDYGRIFSTEYPIELYLVCALAMKTIDRVLGQLDTPISIEERRNFRFHVATIATWTNADTTYLTPSKISGIGLGGLNEYAIKHCLERVVLAYEPHKNHGASADVVAKSSEFVAEMKRLFTEQKSGIGKQALQQKMVSVLQKMIVLKASV